MSLNKLFEQFIGGETGVQTPWASNTNMNPGQNSGLIPGQPSGVGVGGLAGLANTIPGGMMGGLAAGGLLGVLMGNKKMRKKTGKFATGAVGVGGAAALRALAFKAYQNWQQSQGGGVAAQLPPEEKSPHALQDANVPPVPEAFRAKSRVPDQFAIERTTARDGQPFQLALVKAMIVAANADGHIDGDEQQAIFNAVNKVEMEPQDKAVVFDTLQNPPSLSTIASYANGIEQASEIYLVSRMAIDPDQPSERAYLNDLAQSMNLPSGLVDQLEAQFQRAATHVAA